MAAIALTTTTAGCSTYHDALNCGDGRIDANPAITVGNRKDHGVRLHIPDEGVNGEKIVVELHLAITPKGVQQTDACLKGGYVAPRAVFLGPKVDQQSDHFIVRCLYRQDVVASVFRFNQSLATRTEEDLGELHGRFSDLVWDANILTQYAHTVKYY
ncbi:MAG: hypothetical protein BWY68_00554 [bacterium ADurb.Bin400]|nr:MAG: hypothetical protein BWY68_00554 [bacterium ADurb.Bin400]